MPREEDQRREFEIEMKHAKRLAKHLCDFQKYRDAVMGLTRSLISEMNSYPSPPETIKSVMAATCLLLGENENTVKVKKLFLYIAYFLNIN